MITLYLTLIALAILAINAAVRQPARPGHIDVRAYGDDVWPLTIATSDREIVVFKDGTVEDHRGARMRARAVVPTSYWEEAL